MSTPHTPGPWMVETPATEYRVTGDGQQFPALGQCRRCKRPYRVEATVTRIETPTHTVSGVVGWPRVTCKVSFPSVACCGRSVGFRLVRGVRTNRMCDARCTSAKGHNCECSCGGVNHGKAYI